MPAAQRSSAVVEAARRLLARADAAVPAPPPAQPSPLTRYAPSNTNPSAVCSTCGGPPPRRSPCTLRHVQSGVSSSRTGRSARTSRCTTPTAGAPCAIATSRSRTMPPICHRHRGTPSSSSNDDEQLVPARIDGPAPPLVRRQPVAGIARDERGVERGEPEHPVRRPVDRDGEQAVVAASPQPGDGPHCVAADPVGDEPLALRGLLERPARLGAEGDRHRAVRPGRPSARRAWDRAAARTQDQLGDEPGPAGLVRSRRARRRCRRGSTR